ncbi:SUMF1/EgtB/PvdO family nonheme iron enzyme [candidate division TA06 bacterium]|uniref:SUMF1/EgtB/PvdO family nonheme iron enzyme n=1 Tax=candidate division TA06 bacterium TaxID=2250710 RepID=A0A933MJR2_UNCT6|nr:SUMF1/EgtB/PvdO family nonheme iron enzyme [candidate division TA06 bacterium]
MLSRLTRILLFMTLPAALAGKTTISIMDLNTTAGLSASEAVMFSDKLVNDLVTANVYQVVDRSKRDEILKEQGFQQSGACDQGACLVEAGQLLGVQKMVGGTIGKLGAVYSLQLRVIDVKTGAIDKAFSKSYAGDVSILLEAMREAACYFSGIPYQSGQPAGESGEGLVFLGVNPQGFNEYRNQKDGSVMVEIPAGPFSMGSNEGEPDETPVHTINLDHYYIGKYEITIGQFKKYWDATGKKMPKQFSGLENDSLPVINVEWEEAKSYCDWAGLKLPTEAQWEKAARGRDGREYPWGSRWYPERCNSKEKSDGYKWTAPVGSFAQGVSPYGCYDMAGNAWEWCSDWYDKNYYDKSAPNNPTGPASGSFRVMRGGSWSEDGYYCRSAMRFWYDAKELISNRLGFGFRPAK